MKISKNSFCSFRRFGFGVAVGLSLWVVAGASQAAEGGKAEKAKAAKATKSPERWEETIRRFEAADKAQPPAKGGILLVGGSNARRWTDVGAYFPGETVINRGFGGAQLADVVHYFDRIVAPHAPRAIFLNAGGNDLSAGRTPEEVRDAQRAFVARVKAAWPRTKIYQISLPPVLRAAGTPDGLAGIRKVNAMLAELARSEPQLEFVDLVPAFLGADGKPRTELFVADGTHFSAKGYEVVSGLLRARLTSGAAGSVSR